MAKHPHPSVQKSASSRFPPLDFKVRLPALDGLRAFAVLLVFADHFGGGSHGGRVLTILNQIRQRGWVGVDLFFVLSGFLITGILFDTQNDSHFFRRFFARRSVRILPVFYLVAVVLLLLTPVFHYAWRSQQLSFLLYMGDLWANADPSLYEVPSRNHPAATVIIGHLWSLCVEEQFYLLWPLIVWRVRNRVRLLQTALAISALALVLRIAIVLWLDPALAERWIVRTLPFRMDSLLLGGVLALLLRGPRAESWQRGSRWILLGSLALLGSLLSLSPAYDSPWLLTIGFTLTAAASAGLIGMTLRPLSPAYRLFHLRPLRVLGRYSYGFYIFHMLYGSAWIRFLVYISGRVHSLAAGGVIALSTNLATTFLVSMLSYQLFERRFLTLKRHFEYDSELRTHTHAFRA